MSDSPRQQLPDEPLIVFAKDKDGVPEFNDTRYILKIEPARDADSEPWSIEEILAREG